MRNIEHRLYQLFAVAAQIWNRNVVITRHRQTFRELGQDERAHPFTYLMDVDVAHYMCAPVGCKQAVHQGLQAVGFVDDDLGVFQQIVGLDFHFQQLGGTAYAP